MMLRDGAVPRSPVRSLVWHRLVSLRSRERGSVYSLLARSVREDRCSEWAGVGRASMNWTEHELSEAGVHTNFVMFNFRGLVVLQQ